MTDHARHHRSPGWRVAGVAFLVGGLVALVIGCRAQVSAPQPPASAATPVSVTLASSTPPSSATTASSQAEASPTASSQATLSEPQSSRLTEPSPVTPSKVEPTATGPILDRSQPVHVSVPAINVESNLEDIGLESNGEIVTPPLEKNSHAYWLDVSPTPGELGPAVILGHVDSAAYGPAVFFDLGKLRQHDDIRVTRADHTVAVFEVTHVVEYTKADFPTLAVYGNTDHAALRLITCGGTFDPAARSYESNIVVYAQLVDTIPELGDQ